MKNKSLIQLTSAVLASAALLVNTARADHATNFLVAFETEVDARLAASDGENTQEHRALVKASGALNRDSATLQADLNLFAQAAAALNAAFESDVVLPTLEDGVLDAYAAEARARLDAIDAIIGDTLTPRPISNLLFQAEAALDRGNADTNSTPERARAIAFALNKIRAAGNLVRNLYKAPLTLNGETVVFAGKEEDRRKVTITLNENHTYTIPAHGNEEATSGTWSYQRTGANTGTVTLTQDGGGTGTFDLTFSNEDRGSFSGEDTDGETVKGQFNLAQS